MASPLSTRALSSLLAAGWLIAAPWSTAQEPVSAPSIVAQENARRRAAARDALMQVQEARLAYSAKRYTQAVEHYRNALSVLPDGAETKKLRTSICEGLADALIARAIDYRSVGRTEEALDFLREASQLDPQNRRAGIELAHTLDPVRHNPALSPQDVRDIEEVSRLLTLGYSQMDLGKYDQALSAFQAVAKYDRYNEAAKRGIEAVTRLKSEYHRAAHDTVRGRMLSEVDRSWDTADDNAGAAANLTNTISVQEDEQELEKERYFAELIDSIRVSHLSLDNANIEDAIQILTGLTHSHTGASSSSGSHLNFTLDFGPADSKEYQDVINRRVNYSLEDVSLKQAVADIARLFGVDYFIVSTGVEFSTAEQGGRIITRTFTGVDSHIFMESDSSDSDDGGDDDDDVGSSRRLRVKRFNIADFFKANGITSPPGSGYSYNANARRLEVRNTRRNIDLIASSLNDAQSNNWNVVLNIMVVDVSEDDLEDLGFDWIFEVSAGREYSLAGGLEAAYTSITGLPIVTATTAISRRLPPAVTGGLRSINEAEGSHDINTLIERGAVRDFANLRETRSPDVFGIRGVWSALDVSFFMRGLSQKKGVDTLTTPRIVFDPNTEETVTFTNVREMFAPSNYDPPKGNLYPIYFDDDRRQWQQDNIYNDGNYGGADPYSSTFGAARDLISSWLPVSLLNSELSPISADVGTLSELANAAGEGPEYNDYNNNWNDDDNDRRRTRALVAWARGSHPLDYIHYGRNEDGEESMDGIGTILQVHKAEPSPDGSSVRLAFTTVINEFEGFLDWGSPIYVAMRNSTDSQTVQLTPNNIYQPIFKRYITNTNVKIADGAVLVLGGLREARVVRYQDKVPLVGDLPLVGRLFRSEGEHKRRRALLFFAKVNIVDPSGHRINGDSADDPAAQSPMP